MNTDATECEATIILISDIYTERYYRVFLYPACEPFYRDILVFKNKGKVIGLSKICFTCGQQSTIGIDMQSSDMIYQNEYKKLKELVQ